MNRLALRKLQHPRDLFGTHIPILCRVVDATTGPILELGTGGFSTALLDMMCWQSRRRVVSYDNDPVYHEDNLRYQSDYHDIRLVTHWDDAVIDRAWSVALIDHKPGGRRRTEIAHLRDWADYLICHDSEPGANRYYRYADIYPLFRYRFDYTRCRPHTVVLSNRCSLDWLAAP